METAPYTSIKNIGDLTTYTWGHKSSESVLNFADSAILVLTRKT